MSSLTISLSCGMSGGRKPTPSIKQSSSWISATLIVCGGGEERARFSDRVAHRHCVAEFLIDLHEYAAQEISPR